MVQAKVKKTISDILGDEDDMTGMQKDALVAAQAIAEAPMFADVWLDNFVVASVPKEDTQMAMSILQEIAKELNLILHEPTPVSSEVDLLGFTVNLTTKRVTHNEKWIAHFHDIYCAVPHY